MRGLPQPGTEEASLLRCMHTASPWAAPAMLSGSQGPAPQLLGLMCWTPRDRVLHTSPPRASVPSPVRNGTGSVSATRNPGQEYLRGCFLFFRLGMGSRVCVLWNQCTHQVTTSVVGDSPVVGPQAPGRGSDADEFCPMGLLSACVDKSA